MYQSSTKEKTYTDPACFDCMIEMTVTIIDCVASGELGELLTTQEKIEVIEDIVLDLEGVLSDAG